ncbi:MAG TPA: hypothetical protein VF789_03150 [Thermoanaerobaculia bacterium]
MKKKILFLALALTAALGVQLSAQRPPFDPGECFQICCLEDPTRCVTCCTGTVCPAPPCEGGGPEDITTDTTLSGGMS